MSELKPCPSEEHFTITVAELRRLVKGTLMVKSGFNGKILCKDFNPKKHSAIGGRAVTAIWCEIEATKALGFGNIARPITCVYVHGGVEADKHFGRANDAD